MQSTTFTFLAISTFVYISSSLTQVHGYRCSGKWAIHACYGGNGKRSGVPLAASSSSSSMASASSNESDLKDRQYILRQLLLSGRLPKLPTLFPSNSNDIVVDSGSGTSDVDTLYPEVDAEFSRSKDLEKARTLINELLLRKRVRSTLPGDLIDYKR